jgi:hypothetical protein
MFQRAEIFGPKSPFPADDQINRQQMSHLNHKDRCEQLILTKTARTPVFAHSQVCWTLVAIFREGSRPQVSKGSEDLMVISIPK